MLKLLISVWVHWVQRFKMRQSSMDNHLRRVLISFRLDFLIYVKNPNVMMYLRLSQWKVCPLCLHAAKKPHKTSRAPSRSKKCKQHMTCCLPAHTGHVWYGRGSRAARNYLQRCSSPVETKWWVNLSISWYSSLVSHGQEKQEKE